MGKIFIALITIWLSLQGTVNAGMLGGTLSGYVYITDQNLQVVEGAAITAVLTNGPITETAYSLSNGYYFIAVPVEGDYNVTVSKGCFASVSKTIHISLCKERDLALLTKPKQYSNHEIKNKVVQLANSIINANGAETGLALLRAYKLTRKMKSDGTFVTDGHSNYLNKAVNIAVGIVGNINNNQAASPADLALLYYLSNNNFLQPKTAREAFFSWGQKAIQKMIEDNTIDSSDLMQTANWVEVFQLYGFTSHADAFVDSLMEEYITVEDTASYAEVVEVLKRFYDNSTYQSKIKAGVNFLSSLQFNGYFLKEVVVFDALIHDQAYAVMAQAVNCQTTWNNYSMKKGTYWGANALMAMSSNSQNAAEIISALYYSCREGDVDRSGKITGYDALQVSKASVRKVLLNGPALLAADFDGDDKITSFDAQCILKVSVGKTLVPVRP